MTTAPGGAVYRRHSQSRLVADTVHAFRVKLIRDPTGLDTQLCSALHRVSCVASHRAAP